MKKVVAVSLSLLMIGCASAPTQSLAPGAALSMKGKTVTLVRRESPSFVAMTAGKGMFAVAGVGAAAIAGNKLVKENNIQDPAMSISQALAQDLSSKHGVQVNGESRTVAATGDLTEIVKLAEGSDYALDVATNGWSYIYDGFKFSDYFVGYSSKVRLIDVNTSQVVANSTCNYNAKKAGKAPVTRDVLMADNASYIKQELTAAADGCVAQFRAQVL